MPNTYFRFKQFTVQQAGAAMKVTTDAALFGAMAVRTEAGRRSPGNEKPPASPLRMLDIGTGTGLLSLMAAQELPYQITAAELDSAAAEQAAQNFAASPWKGRLQLWQGDILCYPEAAPFDAVICNPPFYEQDLQGPSGSRNSAHHGTTLQWRHLFPKIRSLLNTDGHLYLLLPYKRKAEALDFLAASGLGPARVTEIFPVAGKPPTRIMIMNGTGGCDRIIIKDSSGNYTAAFSDLLRPFYLVL